MRNNCYSQSEPENTDTTAAQRLVTVRVDGATLIIMNVSKIKRVLLTDSCNSIS